MFYSTGNNFGAGAIKFKEARESNYIVLNATVTCDSGCAAFLGAEVLEIYVPELNISRSTETGVVMFFEDSIDSYGTHYNLNKGVFVKSWIKDAHTICIEKLPFFENKGELTIFIQSLYPQLGQGSNTFKVTKQALVDSSPDSYLRFNDSDSIIVVRENWVFIHLLLERCDYSHIDDDWEAVFENMPADIDAVLPLLHTASWSGSWFTGCARPEVRNRHWTLPRTERSNALQNNTGAPFSFAFIVRGDDEE